MPRGHNFILNEDHTPIQVDDPVEWAKWFEAANRVIKQEWIGPYFVSTVFLGLDHNWGGGPPILFETMVFVDGSALDEQTRCSTWDEALRMHENMVAKMRAEEAQAHAKR